MIVTDGYPEFRSRAGLELKYNSKFTNPFRKYKNPKMTLTSKFIGKTTGFCVSIATLLGASRIFFYSDAP